MTFLRKYWGFLWQVVYEYNRANIDNMLANSGNEESRKQVAKVASEAIIGINREWQFANTFCVSPLVRIGEQRVWERLLVSGAFQKVKLYEIQQRGATENQMKLFLRRHSDTQQYFAAAVGTFLCYDLMKREGRSSIKEHNRAEYDFNNAFRALLGILREGKRDDALLFSGDNGQHQYERIEYTDNYW